MNHFSKELHYLKIQIVEDAMQFFEKRLEDNGVSISYKIHTTGIQDFREKVTEFVVDLLTLRGE